MNNPIENINKAFENRIRLGIMSILMMNDKTDFNSLKELLQLTDGNLASHIAAMERAEYIKVHKRFIGRKPQTTYSATTSGRKAFQEHLNAMEKIIRQQKLS